MKIAIPIWDNRVSPVLDHAREMMLVTIDGDREISRETRLIPNSLPPQKARFIAGTGVDLLICGALSRPLEAFLAAAGVQLQPWVRGYIDDVIAAHLGGSLGELEQHFMPGCRGRGRGMGRGRGFGRRGKGKFNF